MSIPAVDPQLRPAGKSPQFRVTTGLGLGIPIPEMLLPLIASGCAAVDEDELISAPPQAESASDTQSARGRRPNLIGGRGLGHNRS